MALWTAPITWAVDTALSVARLNEQLRDNLLALKAATVPQKIGWYLTGTLAVGTNKSAVISWDGGCTFTITKVVAVAKTGPVGADLILDINLDGTSIWNATPANRIKIADGATAGSQTSFDDNTIADGQDVTIDVDQIGSGTAGANVTVIIYGIVPLAVS